MKGRRRFLVLALGAVLGVFVLDRFYVPPVLVYTRIDERPDDPKFNVSPDSFERQMEFLKAHRFQVLSLSDYLGILKEKKPIPKKSVVITFDGGTDDNFSRGYPVLRKMDFPATVFVATEKIGEPGYLDAEDLGIMVENRVEIGSRGRTDVFLAGLPAKAAEDEIAGSKADLEKAIERPVALFSYPGGGYTEETARLVEAAGYEGAVTTNRGGREPLDLYALRRIRISRSCDNLFVFWFKTSGFYTWIEQKDRYQVP